MEHPDDEPMGELQARLRRVEQEAQIGVWEWDLDTSSIRWSEGTWRILGRSPGELPRDLENLLACIHPLDRGAVTKAISDPLPDSERRELEFRIVRPDGAIRWVRASVEGSSQRAARRALVSGTVRDMTGEHRLLDKLRGLRKRHLLGALARGFAHDFNNFLTVIRGRVELAAADSVLSDSSRDSLEQAIGAADRAANLMRQLTVFSQTRTARIERCDLNKVISEMMTLLSRIVGDAIEVHQCLGPDLPLAEADQGLVEECLMHLVMAAKQAAPGGGILTVSTEAVCSSDVSKRQFVRILVHCTGGGIDPAGPGSVSLHHPTDEEDFQDAEIHLQAAHDLAEQSRGRVEVVSPPDGGAGFEIGLPLAPPSGTPGRAGDGKLDLRGGSEGILLVMDDDGVRAFVRLLLSRLGYRTVETAGAQEALRVWREHGGEFDLLLTDLVEESCLKDWELAAEMRRSKPGLRTVALTSHSHSAPIPVSEAEIHYLAKPFTAEALAQAVRKCLDGRGGSI